MSRVSIHAKAAASMPRYRKFKTTKALAAEWSDQALEGGPSLTLCAVPCLFSASSSLLGLPQAYSGFKR